jgi:transmembrane sensor
VSARTANSVPSSAHITDQAANWIQRRDFWHWGEAEQASLDAWLAESLAHRIAYFRLDAAWSRTARLAALRSGPCTRGVARGQAARPTIIKTAAAIFVVGLVALSGLNYFSRSPESRYRTTMGERKMIALSDGSRIELNTNTELTVQSGKHQRVVTLVHGEAYFQIKHDSEHRFEVIAGDHRVTDLGTKFLVRSDPGLLKVELLEGSAQFDAPDGRMGSPILLVPGERLVVANNLIRTTLKTTESLTNELGWRRGMLIFENAPLTAVADEFNRYNREKIVVANDGTANVRITASFRTSGTEDFKQLAQAMLGLRVQHLNGETVISR